MMKLSGRIYPLDAKKLNGDIVSNIDDAIIFLKKHLRISYKIETLKRENILELPEDALREAIVNAVCHRNYFEKGARVMVEIFDNRVDIVSPGGVCKGITKENFGSISITRNSTIASLLHRIDYIEQMGTGIIRMKKAAKDAKVAMPKFELENFFKVSFERNDFQSTTSSDKQAIASDRQAIETSDRNVLILTYLKNNKAASATDISALLGLSKVRARAILQEMVNNGKVKKVSDKRYAYYVLKK